MGVIDARGLTSDVGRLGAEQFLSKFKLSRSFYFLVVAFFVIPLTSHAATIAEDRADVLYHAYDGGGVTISGPSFLVRKGYKEKVSVYANYYVDLVSSASIDVVTQGSKYSEERTEYSVGMDYLHEKTTLSMGVGNSTEGDYVSDSGHFGISQSFFGDLTTLTMGYSHAENVVMMNEPEGDSGSDEEEFRRDAKQRRFNMGLSQILTKSWILALNVESIVDDGYLNNPYRSVRFANPDGTFGRQREVYPETRNSDAYALRSMYYLPYRASIRFEGRYFKDSWGITAQNIELRYAHPYQEKYIFEIKARTYSQSGADFYQDMFAYRDAPAEGADPEFRASDKEMSPFSSINIGFGVTYDLQKEWRFLSKQTVTLYFDAMRFDYDEFRDGRLSMGDDALFNPGEEPTYSLNANVLRLFYSAYY